MKRLQWQLSEHGRTNLATADQNPLKRRTKDNVVQGAPKGQTFGKRHYSQPKCNIRMRGRGLKQ
jgi:hypothetical protein